MPSWHAHDVGSTAIVRSADSCLIAMQAAAALPAAASSLVGDAPGQGSPGHGSRQGTGLAGSWAAGRKGMSDQLSCIRLRWLDWERQAAAVRLPDANAQLRQLCHLIGVASSQSSNNCARHIICRLPCSRAEVRNSSAVTVRRGITGAHAFNTYICRHMSLHGSHTTY